MPSLSLRRAIKPETEYILVVSNASSKLSGGRIEGKRLAIILSDKITRLARFLYL
jgi:hypothetical protein